MAGFNKSPVPQSGYTLLEVTIALIIIGISLGVLFAQLSRSKALSFKADMMMESCRILHNLTENSLLVKKALEDGEITGEVPDENKWIYSIKTQPLEIQIKPEDEPVEIPEMKQLEICIQKDETGNGKKYCIKRWYHKK